MIPISVLVADDNKMVRDGIKRVLEEEPDIKFVGEASDFTEAAQAIESLKPQVVLLDMNMPGNLVHLRQALEAHRDDTRVIVLSVFVDSSLDDFSREIGGFASIDKMEIQERLIPAIYSAASSRLPN